MAPATPATPATPITPTTPAASTPTTNPRKRSRRKTVSNEEGRGPGEMPAWRVNSTNAEKEEANRESLENFLFSRQKKLEGEKAQAAGNLLKNKGITVGTAATPPSSSVPSTPLSSLKISTIPIPIPTPTAKSSASTPTSTPSSAPPDIRAFLFWRQGAMVQNIMAGKGGGAPLGQAPFPLATPQVLLGKSGNAGPSNSTNGDSVDKRPHESSGKIEGGEAKRRKEAEVPKEVVVAHEPEATEEPERREEEVVMEAPKETPKETQEKPKAVAKAVKAKPVAPASIPDDDEDTIYVATPPRRRRSTRIKR